MPQFVKMRPLSQQRFHTGIMIDNRGENTLIRMKPIEKRHDRLIAVVRQHLFLCKAAVDKDSAFHPGIAKVETEGRRHG